MVAHLAHTSSLNETCDVCSMHEKKLRYGEMWLEIDLIETLILYGTAGPEKKPKLCLEQACFKGFEDLLSKPIGQKKRARTKK